MPSPETNLPLHFRQRHRLTHAREFKAVYDARIRKSRGPFVLQAVPNTLDSPRLGLAVGTRVGSAVVRNRWKRLVRESFRLLQHALPASPDGGRYDYVVSIRSSPDQPVWTLAGCSAALADLAAEIDREWRRRSRQSEAPTQPPPSP
ncbi:MAG TPA: ribonuclease P protein component [Phycisphaerales bacterium]|nr:ribonuclease P protein component [Phycisphaerales bacterium]